MDSGLGLEPTEAQAQPEPRPASEPALSPGDLLEKLNKAAATAKETVAALRGVTFTDDIQPDYKSLDTLADITRGFFRRDYLRQ